MMDESSYGEGQGRLENVRIREGSRGKVKGRKG